jgi:hypothetical protein
MEMTWHERIENYRRLIGVPYLGCENGRVYGTWPTRAPGSE